MHAFSEPFTYTARHQRLIACDSDGCAFDVMELKHKECFCPAFIKHFGLQRCAKQARQVWEFVNLYSRTRGCNRFQGVGYSLKLLAEHPEVRAAGITLPDFSAIHRFLDHAEALGEPALARETEATGAPALRVMLEWSREVNVAVAAMCRGMGPFPHVAEALQLAARDCDILVVSQAPRKTLLHEWAESGLTAYTAFVAGQEFGSKAAQVRQAQDANPSLTDILVLGDAPGDQTTAEVTNAKFFPIIPGNEVTSWDRFKREGLPRFLAGCFDAGYQAALLETFSHALPDNPPWMERNT